MDHESQPGQDPRPLVSVVIPTYNRWPLVGEAVRSVLAQDFQDFEVVVVDDGSTDGTREHLESLHPSVRVLTTSRQERLVARNRGIAEARGRFVAFLDSDDVFDAGHLSQFASIHRQRPDEKLFVAAHRFWEPDTGRTQVAAARDGPSSELMDALLLGTLAPTSAMIVERDCLLEAGGIPEDPSLVGGEDWVLFTRLVPKHAVVGLPRPSVRIRHHPGRSMQDATRMISARRAITLLLLTEGLDGVPLSHEQRRALLVGSHRFYYAHLYQSGDMSGARNELRQLRQLLSPGEALRSTGVLWAQTWLGSTGSRAARRMKVALTWRRES